MPIYYVELKSKVDCIFDKMVRVEARSVEAAALGVVKKHCPPKYWVGRVYTPKDFREMDRRHWRALSRTKAKRC